MRLYAVIDFFSRTSAKTRFGERRSRRTAERGPDDEKRVFTADKTDDNENTVNAGERKTGLGIGEKNPPLTML